MDREPVAPHLVILAACASTLVLAMLLTPAPDTDTSLRIGGRAVPTLCVMKQTSGLPCPGVRVDPFSGGCCKLRLGGKSVAPSDRNSRSRLPTLAIVDANSLVEPAELSEKAGSLLPPARPQPHPHSDSPIHQLDSNSPRRVVGTHDGVTRIKKAPVACAAGAVCLFFLLSQEVTQRTPIPRRFETMQGLNL